MNDSDIVPLIESMAPVRYSEHNATKRVTPTSITIVEIIINNDKKDSTEYMLVLNQSTCPGKHQGQTPHMRHTSSGDRRQGRFFMFIVFTLFRLEHI